jgi:predicted aspartyl protease
MVDSASSLITGTVRTGREAVIPLQLIGSGGQIEEIEAVIDTGFNGFLTLPATLTTLLGLPFHHEEEALLADGEPVLFAVYTSTLSETGQRERFSRWRLVGMLSSAWPSLRATASRSTPSMTAAWRLNLSPDQPDRRR